MKTFNLTFAFFFFSLVGLAQAPFSITEDETIVTLNSIENIGDNGFKFEALTTGINTKFADYSAGLFRDKFISVSARKIGAIAKKDPATNEPYTNIYCSDILPNYDLKRSLLFSSLLNNDENLGSVSFSEDALTMYFTKSYEGNTQKFRLFKTTMVPEQLGVWKDVVEIPINNEAYSVENPHLSKDGKTLFFASNMEGGKGGYDIYQVAVNEDGTYGKIEPVKGNINTDKDEKYPHLSVDQKFLFFSSKGHENAGGYDVFKTRRTKKGYVTILNLGNTINTENDEIAFVPATELIGYISSDRDGGRGNYDIYRITEYVKPQNVKGRAIDFSTGEPIAGAKIQLVDTDGTVTEETITNKDGEYYFPVSSFEYYTITSEKEDYLPGATVFNSDNVTPLYEMDVTLKVKPAEIVETKEKSYIKIDNIQFDYDSAKIKEVSEHTLNKVAQTLFDNPEIKIAINAHTDFRGNDAYNLNLSDKRAASALEYLEKKGITRDRLTWKGYGETDPLEDCEPCTEAQHQKNRRIEFVILK